LETLTNAEEIKENLSNSYRGFTEGEMTAGQLLQEVTHELKSISSYNQDFAQLHDRLESARIELEDLAREIEQHQQNIILDEERIREITDRLNLIYKLEKKHGVQTVAELNDIHGRLHDEVSTITGLDEEIGEKEVKLEQLLLKLNELGGDISDNRKKAISRFEKEANQLLPEVGMPNGHLSVNLTRRDQPAKSGFDDITFYFTANKGHHKLPLHKVASGGELSRVMLIIKSLVAASTALPTLIFDEIDTGISGETARKVGSILKALANNHQVIAITHLPQIAGKGNVHYYVYKETANGQTYTRIRALQAEERTQEIAKMISGDQPTTAAIENARELLAD
jgi:DNA repair protein RecN (Recombination protein N)